MATMCVWPWFYKRGASNPAMSIVQAANTPCETSIPSSSSNSYILRSPLSVLNSPPAMASRSALIALLVVLGCSAAASADTFTVGDGQGWTTGVDYTTWTSGKTFAAGDKLVFNYASGAHTVTEVSKSDYEVCSSSNAISNAINGPTTVTVGSGTHYYICTIGSHCSSGGMKLAVTAGSGSPATPATPGTPTPTTPTTSTPTGASARMQAAPALAVAATVLVKLALF